MPMIPINKSQTKQNPTEKQAAVFAVTDPKYSLSDLILAESTLEELETVISAHKCWKKIFDTWGLGTVMHDRKSLFVNLYGASGTGKTMAAHAIARALNKKMICVNYADIESKFVGETSKNLTCLFQNPENSDHVIFFDEADALLSKRVTEMSSATDVSVNQTRSVLLTLLNDYEGIVIFATNFISNYDSAFMRRIQYHIKFELPNRELREKLWRMYIPPKMPIDVDISTLAEKYDDLSGSDISNAVLKAALKAARKDQNCVKQADFEEAVESIIKSKRANISQNEKVISKSEIIPEEEVPLEIRNRAKK